MSGEHPAGLPAIVRQLWDEGAQETEVHAGDLWVLSWNQRVEGVVLIVAVKSGYVLAWPVTLPGEVSFSPGLVVEDSPLGVPLTLWPTRETGIGNHLLDRSLGRLVERDRIRAIATALDEGVDPGMTFATGSARDPENAEADRMMVDHWTDLCFNSGGAHDDLFLDAAKVQKSGGNSRIVGEVLGLALPELRSLMTGVVPASADQIAAVAERLGVDGASLVGADPLADVLVDIGWPIYKHLIVERAEQTGIDEVDIRRYARREFALAARDDGDAMRGTKLRDAINRAGR